jgi:hypothetical protein
MTLTSQRSNPVLMPASTFVRAAIGLAALLFAVVVAATPATASDGSLAVDIRGRCSADPIGLLVDMAFKNPNWRPAPRVITVYRDGGEFFEDIDVAPPGKSTLTYGPLPRGTWRIVVVSRRRTIADATFALGCGGQPRY